MEHSLDEKGRLIVPSRFRERLGPGFVLTAFGRDPCLALYSSAAWNRICEGLEGAPRKDEAYRRAVRWVFAHTQEPTCDAQGRILIPAPLRAHASIERDVISVGALTHVEIWAKERFAEYAQPRSEDADLFGELGLA